MPVSHLGHSIFDLELGECFFAICTISGTRTRMRKLQIPSLGLAGDIPDISDMWSRARTRRFLVSYHRLLSRPIRPYKQVIFQMCCPWIDLASAGTYLASPCPRSYLKELSRFQLCSQKTLSTSEVRKTLA